MSDHSKDYSPARLRGIADWFREFAAMGSAAERGSWIDLAASYDQLAVERENRRGSPQMDSINIAATK